MKITKYKNHIVILIDKYWLSIDKTGLMTWNGKRNHYLIWSKNY